MNMRYLNSVLILFLISGLNLHILSQTNQSVIKKLSENADLIVTGKVMELSSDWNETGTRIYTKATIQVEESIKGGSQNFVEIRYPGGEVGDVGEMYSHMPTFKNKEEVLVFLKKDKTGSGYKVLNGEEGKLSVITDTKTGEKITSQNVKVKTLTAQIKNYVND